MKIEKGDIVDVFFENSNQNEFGLTVQYVPVATGDSWHLTTEDNDVVYIQLFSKMIKRSK